MIDNKYKWPLAINDFSLLDRFKICSFFLNFKNRWTQDIYVKIYEDKLKEYVSCLYSVFVSSGSVANQLVAQYTKDKLIRNGLWPKKNKVIFNSVTWTTNISPFIREGFEPIFVDVNLNDFCLDYKKTEDIIKKNKDQIALVFPTAVLGFTPNIEKLYKIKNTYDIDLKLDACENLMGEYEDLFHSVTRNICSFFTSTTSCFVAHQITTGSEGGFIFTSDKQEYIYYLLSRAHGLRRNILSYSNNITNLADELNKCTNTLVDSQFDFQTLSSNYRSSDIAAFCGLLDFKKIDDNKLRRIFLYELYYDNLDSEKYYLPNSRKNITDVPFCLPIIIWGEDKENRIKKVKELLDEQKIEKRSFISGNILRHIPYQKYGNYKDYKNAEYLNNFALYIGLHRKVKEQDILDLVQKLNNI